MKTELTLFISMPMGKHVILFVVPFPPNGGMIKNSKILNFGNSTLKNFSMQKSKNIGQMSLEKLIVKQKNEFDQDMSQLQTIQECITVQRGKLTLP